MRKKKKGRTNIKLFELSHIVKRTVLGGITETIIRIAFRREMGGEFFSCIFIRFKKWGVLIGFKVAFDWLRNCKGKKTLEIPSCFNHCPLQASLMTSRCIHFILLFWHSFQTISGSVNIRKKKEKEKKKMKNPYSASSLC